MELTKHPTMLTIIWKFFTENSNVFTPLFYLLLTIVGFGLNFIYSTLNNKQIDTKLIEIRSETVHTRIDGFAASLSAFRDEAYRLEKENNDLHSQNDLLLDCIQRNDCNKYPQILKRRDKSQVNIAQSYAPIRELLGETYKQEIKK